MTNSDFEDDKDEQQIELYSLNIPYQDENDLRRKLFKRGISAVDIISVERVSHSTMMNPWSEVIVWYRA